MALATRISEALIGLSCTDVLRFDTKAWRFEFGRRTTLDVRCPWRIIANGRIALGYGDHEQQFGLPQPLDGVSEAKRLLANPVEKVTVREGTADLVIHMDGNVSFEAFNDSTGYEGWECCSDNGLLAIAVGGGDLQVFLTDPPVR